MAIWDDLHAQCHVYCDSSAYLKYALANTLTSYRLESYHVHHMQSKRRERVLFEKMEDLRVQPV